MNRRALLEASAATGAAGVLAGCSGTSVLGGGGNPEACPTITGIENGFVWVQKTVDSDYPQPWEYESARPSDEVLDPDDEGYAESRAVDIRRSDVRGSGRIGNGEVEFHEPGTYTFEYQVDDQGYTWVEKPRDLLAIVFPAAPFEDTGLVRQNDIVAGGLYPFTEDEPMSLEFEITEPGTYRIAYGPSDGIFMFEEWFPDPRDRSRHFRLGLKVEGDESASSWVYPELPEHVSAWIGSEDVVLSRDVRGHGVVECQFDRSRYQ